MLQLEVSWCSADLVQGNNLPDNSHRESPTLRPNRPLLHFSLTYHAFAFLWMASGFIWTPCARRCRLALTNSAHSSQADLVNAHMLYERGEIHKHTGEIKLFKGAALPGPRQGIDRLLEIKAVKTRTDILITREFAPSLRLKQGARFRRQAARDRSFRSIQPKAEEDDRAVRARSVVGLEGAGYRIRGDIEAHGGLHRTRRAEFARVSNGVCRNVVCAFSGLTEDSVRQVVIVFEEFIALGPFESRG